MELSKAVLCMRKDGWNLGCRKVGMDLKSARYSEGVNLHNQSIKVGFSFLHPFAFFSDMGF